MWTNQILTCCLTQQHHQQLNEAWSRRQCGDVKSKGERFRDMSNGEKEVFRMWRENLQTIGIDFWCVSNKQFGKWCWCWWMRENRWFNCGKDCFAFLKSAAFVEGTFHSASDLICRFLKNSAQNDLFICATKFSQNSCRWWKNEYFWGLAHEQDGPLRLCMPWSDLPCGHLHQAWSLMLEKLGVCCTCEVIRYQKSKASSLLRRALPEFVNCCKHLKSPAKRVRIGQGPQRYLCPNVFELCSQRDRTQTLAAHLGNWCYRFRLKKESAQNSWNTCCMKGVYTFIVNYSNTFNPCRNSRKGIHVFWHCVIEDQFLHRRRNLLLQTMRDESGKFQSSTFGLYPQAFCLKSQL